MQLEPDGMQVKRVNENAWAVVDCELSGADEAEWCFQSIEDLNNDEGTCYGSQQPKACPHARIPAARLFFAILCFSVFSSTSGNPEVGGGDNFSCS